MTTKERLAQRLEALGAHELAERARKGMYSDFESEVAMPKVLLVADLKLVASTSGSQETWHSLHAMAQEIIDGKWDDTPEEAEAWAAAQTGEMREMIDRLPES